MLLLCPCLGAQVIDEAAPSFSPDSIVNSANNSSASLAPNVLATVYGLNLAFTTVSVPLGLSATDLPRRLGNVQVFVGNITAALLYVSQTQINFLIPGILRAGTTSVQVLRESTSATVQTKLIEVAPALFLVEGGIPAITHVDGKLVTADAPALPGEIVIAWGAGLGATTLKLADGAIPRAAGTILLLDQFRVVLGDQILPAASVLYAGVAPGFPGLYQINLRLPEIILTKQPEFRIGFENQMSQSGLLLQVSPSAP